MKKPHWNTRFLASTRGQIVGLLRAGSRTVGELAKSLKLTESAVRAHLTSLERDGLVHQSGLRRAFRKPHYSYSLTVEAEHLFPKAHDLLINQLLNVLDEHLDPLQQEEVLREVGQRMAAGYPHRSDIPLPERLKIAVQAFGDLGGMAELEEHDGQLFIRGDSCPLGSTAAQHPEVCRLAETMVAEILGRPVTERCQRGEKSQCCFEISGVSAD